MTGHFETFDQIRRCACSHQSSSERARRTLRLNQPNPIEKEISMLKSLALAITLVAFAACGIVYAQNTTSPPPTDPQIAMIAVVADAVDIDAGSMAAKKTKNKLVREFAKTMVRDHTAVNGQATALAKNIGRIPEGGD